MNATTLLPDAPASTPSTAPRGLQIQPYVFFEGRCEEAIEFYRRSLGAEVLMLMRFSDSPDGPCPGAEAVPGNKIMHATVRIGASTLLMSDGQCQAGAQFQGFSLSLNVTSEAEARRLFDGLSDGGQVIMPLGKTFFADSFGMVADRFGVSWMIYLGP